MAFNRNKYLKNGELDKKYFNFDESNIDRYIIPLKYEGRPDLIAFEIYGDTSYQVFLTYFNKIYDTPEGYYRGRVLKFVNRSFLE